MRIPLTKYGWPQVVDISGNFNPDNGGLFHNCPPVSPSGVCLPNQHHASLAARTDTADRPDLGVFFFQGPLSGDRSGCQSAAFPADGTVAAVEMLDGYEGFEGPVLRIEIFLSVFNVHINRVPCPVRIGQITYKPGKFLDARNPQCSKVNEANELELFRLDDPPDRMLVRQISGAIARRIVCDARTGQQYTGGQQFGMIKFGSCTELFVPARENLKTQVRKGDTVKAGLTILARYE